MKRILFIIMVMMFISCDHAAIESAAEQRLRAFTSILKIDDCEYVIYEGSSKGGITHKGNCSNPIHKVQPKTNEIILN